MADETNTNNTAEGGAANNQQQTAGTQQKPAAAQQQAQEESFQYTQKELDRIIEGRLARERKVQQQLANDPQALQKQQQDTAQQGQQTQQDALNLKDMEAKYTGVQQELLTARVEAALYRTPGVKAEKVERAARLVDYTKCVDKDGAPDKEKIQKEIDEMLKDFPEFKGIEGEGAAGFKIGADGSKKGNATADQITAIFGNNKK